MTNLFTQTQTETLAHQAGFTVDNAKIAAAIAMCEAPYVKDGVGHVDFAAIGDQNLATAIWGYSYGGWQVRSLRAERGTGRTRDELRLPDPLFNALSARRIKLDAGSFKPWSTFTGGQYKAYLQEEFPPPPGSYVVVSGDTLSGIALKLGNKFSWQELAAANGKQSPYTVYIGELLLLPWTSTGV